MKTQQASPICPCFNFLISSPFFAKCGVDMMLTEVTPVSHFEFTLFSNNMADGTLSGG